jgi:tetratricopeptide (TPR) repeat protein
VAFNKEKVMDAARKFVDKGQIDKAVKEYLRIVQEDPKDVRVWLKIGDLYAKKGAKQDATDTYMKVARFYHDQGFFLKAVAVYKQILKLDPRQVDVTLKLAELYRQLGLMSDAMQHYEAVAAHFHREGNTKEALDTVKKLVDLDPENIATRIKLAELYSKEGLVEEAVQQFNMACEQLRRQNRQDDFVKVAERLLWHKPDNHALNRELAGLYLRRNDPRRALQKLQACFKADPRDVETLGLLALAFQALDQKAKTVSVLKELARIHVENKARDRAVDVYRKILEIVPNDTDALQFIGPAEPPARATPTPLPPPLPPSRNTPPPPPMTMKTPLPSAVRAASEAAKFNITSDLPSLGHQGAGLPRGMTGSMPLVDEQSLSGVDFALPEYDDPDFSADMEPPPDPRRASAAGERHAEEISKILAETDVYVKYGLHQKAVDHLRRVFTLDEQNVEAHERLKDIFISQGREEDAEGELLKLAELIAPADPDRAEQYLQELLAMNGTHTGAFDLARRFRLRVARTSVSAEVDYAGGGVSEIDPDMDDLDLNAAPPPSMGVARGGHRDSIDEFDPDDLIGGNLAHGSPTPQRPPAPPADYYEGEDDSAVLVDSPYGYTDEAQGIDAQLDDAALGEDIDQEVAAELGGTRPGAYPGHESDLEPEDLPFDPADARAFDAGNNDETAQPHDESLAVSGSYDPYGTEAGIQAAPGFESTTMGSPMIEEEYEEPRAETPLVEDDLEEVDFYAHQGMYDEALESLQALMERHPNHRLLLAKMHEIDALRAGYQPSLETPPAGTHDIPLDPDGTDHTGGMTDAIDMDEIEEVSADDLEEVDEGRPSSNGKRKPTVMLEKPVDEGDAETHYDLGLAYKEMGLFDEAIKAFEKVLRAPGREIQCRVMIGMCHREQGHQTDAINEFKQGLHANGSDRERLSLYYEIGITYEAMGDTGEALYYFDAVVKRDPRFADAAQRAEHLRSRGSQPITPDDDI